MIVVNVFLFNLFFSCLSSFTYFLIIVFKVDLGRIMKVHHIATQGANDGKGYIKSYTISTKNSPSSQWKPLIKDDKPQVGNLAFLTK